MPQPNSLFRLVSQDETVMGERPTLQSGGGGGTFDGMEARVKTLEDDMKKLLQDTAEIKGMLRSAPSAVDFGELKGRVNSLPTMAKTATMLSLATTVILILNNWSTLKAWLIG